MNLARSNLVSTKSHLFHTGIRYYVILLTALSLAVAPLVESLLVHPYFSLKIATGSFLIPYIRIFFMFLIILFAGMRRYQVYYQVTLLYVIYLSFLTIFLFLNFTMQYFYMTFSVFLTMILTLSIKDDVERIDILSKFTFAFFLLWALIFLVRFHMYGSLIRVRSGSNIYSSGVLIPAILILMSTSGVSQLKVRYSTLGIILSLVSLISLNRGGLIISMLVWFGMIFKRKSTDKKVSIRFIIIMLLVLAFLMFLFSSVDHIYTLLKGRFDMTSSDVDISDLPSRLFFLLKESQRVGIWSHGWSVFMSNPYFGIGPENFSNFPLVSDEGGIFSGPHNLLLDIFVSFGVIFGFFVFLIIFVYPVFKLLVVRKYLCAFTYILFLLFTCSSGGRLIHIAPYYDTILLFSLTQLLILIRRAHKPVENVKNATRIERIVIEKP